MAPFRIRRQEGGSRSRSVERSSKAGDQRQRGQGEFVGPERTTAVDGHPNRTDDDQVRRKRSDAEQERLNRELSEMLQEVRVAMPGVQLLFGFLLAVPFNQRFGQTTSAERGIYLFTLLCSAAASALFIAPTAAGPTNAADCPDALCGWGVPSRR